MKEAWRPPLLSSAAEGVDAAQILRDRPDVFAAYYSEYFGPLNDRHSSAWIDRVGGETALDYARYWYEAHGRAEGYTQEPGATLAAAAEETAGVGRTTSDGVPLARILADRPDVFQAFFTEYYGPNNDRHSDAWIKRVGGTTVEDYADYWYNAYGKVSGYTPSVTQATQPPPESDSPPPQPEDPRPTAEDPALPPPTDEGAAPDPITPPPADPDADYPYARPLVGDDDGGFLTLRPATLDEIAAMQATATLFDDDVVG